MKKIAKIYDMLYSYFGPQHWWPVTSPVTLYPEYSDGPKNEKQELEVVFGAILTQNTSWKNAEKAIIVLNKEDLFDVDKINDIDVKKLADLIKSSGYHNQKARKLKNFSEYLLENYRGKLHLLFSKNIEELREELLTISGIGPETADSIILYAAKKPVFVIDAYTKRILNRIGYKEETYNELQTLCMENLPNNEKLFNECHALLVELGKGFCRKTPLCNECPLNKHCNYCKQI
ncbi:MAG: endonuclease III domain-containing protein [Nanoarchaeota archaeon]